MAYIMNSAFLDRLADGYRFSFSNTTNASNTILLYKGTMPTDADSWSTAGYSSDLLATWTGWELDAGVNNLTMVDNPSPATVVASATGTAAWAALYNTSLGENQVLLTDVTVDGGGGGLIIDDVNVVSGNNVTYVNFIMTFAEV